MSERVNQGRHREWWDLTGCVNSESTPHRPPARCISFYTSDPLVVQGIPRHRRKSKNTRKENSTHTHMGLASWLVFIINTTQSRVTRKFLNRELPLPDWPGVDMSAGHCLA